MICRTASIDNGNKYLLFASASCYNNCNKACLFKKTASMIFECEDANFDFVLLQMVI